MGADPSLMSAQTWLSMKSSLEDGGLVFVSVGDNLVDNVWTEANGRPPFTVRQVL